MSTPAGNISQPPKRTSSGPDQPEPADRDVRPQRLRRQLADVVDEVVLSQLMPPSTISRRSTWEEEDEEDPPLQTPRARWKQAYENRHKVASNPKTVTFQVQDDRDFERLRDRSSHRRRGRSPSPPARIREYNRPARSTRSPQASVIRNRRYVGQSPAERVFDEPRTYDPYREYQQPSRMPDLTSIRKRQDSRPEETDRRTRVSSDIEIDEQSGRLELKKQSSWERRRPTPPRRRKVIQVDSLPVALASVNDSTARKPRSTRREYSDRPIIKSPSPPDRTQEATILGRRSPKPPLLLSPSPVAPGDDGDDLVLSQPAHTLGNPQQPSFQYGEEITENVSEEAPPRIPRPASGDGTAADDEQASKVLATSEGGNTSEEERSDIVSQRSRSESPQKQDHVENSDRPTEIGEAPLVNSRPERIPTDEAVIGTPSWSFSDDIIEVYEEESEEEPESEKRYQIDNEIVKAGDKKGAARATILAREKKSDTPPRTSNDKDQRFSYERQRRPDRDFHQPPLDRANLKEDSHRLNAKRRKSKSYIERLYQLELEREKLEQRADQLWRERKLPVAGDVDYHRARSSVRRRASDDDTLGDLAPREALKHRPNDSDDNDLGPSVNFPHPDVDSDALNELGSLVDFPSHDDDDEIRPISPPLRLTSPETRRSSATDGASHRLPSSPRSYRDPTEYRRSKEAFTGKELVKYRGRREMLSLQDPADKLTGYGGRRERRAHKSSSNEIVIYPDHHEKAALQSPADPRLEFRMPELEDDIFTFTLQRRRPKSQLSADETTISMSDPKSVLPFRSSTFDKNLKYVQTYVYDSRYITESLRGHKTGEMISSTDKPKDGASSLYRWIHFNDATMWFNDFRKNVAQIEGLKQVEHEAITRLLDRVQNDIKKPSWSTKTGSGRSPKPPSGSVIEEAFRDVSRTPGKAARLQKAVWVCLPFFCVRPYAKTANTAIQTLLQSHYSTSTDRQRDIQQAVSDLPDMRPKHGFHTTEVWCLILNDSLLVTSAPVERQDLFPRSAVSQVDVSRPEPRRVRVALGEAVQYSFTFDQCQTWFDLCCQFAELFPYRVTITFRGDAVDEKSWPEILNMPEHKHKDIFLDLDLGELKDSPARTVLQDPYPEAWSRSQTLAPETIGESHKGSITSRAADDGDLGNDEILTEPLDPVPAASLTIPNPPALTGDGEQQSSQPGEDDTTDKPPAAIGQENTQAGLASKSWSTLEFSAFGWLAVEKEDQTDMPNTIDFDRLQEDLKEVEGQFKRLHDKHQSFEEHSHSKDYATLNNRQVVVTHNKVWSYVNGHYETTQKSKQSIDMLPRRRVIMFNLAEDLFKFFLPLDLEGPTTTKYWGAVFRLLLPRQFVKVMKGEGQEWTLHDKEAAATFDDTQLELMQLFLQRLVRKTDPVRRLLSAARVEWRAKVKIPDSSLSAWLYIIRALMQCANRSFAWRDNISKASQLIDEVTKEIMGCLATLTGPSITTKIVLRPAEIVSIVGFNLLSGLNGGSRNINDTYTEYIRALARKVDNDPMNHSHRDKFDRLQREVQAAIVVLDQQRLTLQGLDALLKTASIRRATTSATEVDAYLTDDSLQAAAISTSVEKLLPTDLGGYYKIFVRSCFEKIRSQMEDLCFVIEEVQRLEVQTERRIESNKSQREAAIYIFTIVTVIFLPLSTVASILGMNTNDIRNTDLDQWVFWVVAVPLVIFVVFLCLKLGDFWPNFTALWNQGRLRFPFRIVWNKDVIPADDDYSDDPPANLIRKLSVR